MPSFRDYIGKLACELIPKPSTVLETSNRHIAMQGRIPMSSRKGGLRIHSTRPNPQQKRFQVLSTKFKAQAELSSKEQFYKDMRDIFNCGDQYSECNTSEDCNSILYQCYNQQCVPNLLHCSNTGCSSEYEECDNESGECESTRRTCSTDDQCAEGFECQDGECYKEETFCRSDIDCAGVIQSGEPTPKCDTEKKECVPCNFGQPSLCAQENPSKPSCHVLDHICYESCDPVLSDYNKCCDTRQVADPRAQILAPHRLENCCTPLTGSAYLTKDWGGLEKCCLDANNSGVGTGRMCTYWAGKSGNESCCAGLSCDAPTGKCE